MKDKKMTHQFELSRLKNMVKDNVIKDKSLSDGFKNSGIVNGITEQVGNAVQPLIKGSEFQKKIASLVKSGAGKKMLGAVPVLGGLAQAAMSGDALAAIDPTDSEELGRDSDVVNSLQNEEALMNVPHENFADKDVSEQARRWQKIRGMIGG